MVPCLEAVNQPTLYLRSILNVYAVFEPLHMLWMGIWVHRYTVTPVQVGAKIWKNFGCEGWAQITSWCVMFGGCKPPHSASSIHIARIKSIWAPSYAVDDGHVGAPLHPYTCACGGQILEIWGLGWAQTPIIHGAMFGACKPTHFVSQIHIKCLWSVWATSYAVDRHMGAPLHSFTCAGGGKFQILEIWG